MNPRKNTYFDYAATTPVDERVLNEMLPFFSEHFGNPSSIHIQGQNAEGAVEDARVRVATIVNCKPEEIIFTSCGSEADNLALRGVAFERKRLLNAAHILVPPTEHHAIIKTVRQLGEIYGFEIEYLPVNEFGITTAKDVEQRIRNDTAIVSVMYANNEIGTINPISEIGEVCQGKGVPFHTDAVQAAAYLPVKQDELKTDLISLGAHKFYGPKGVGVLYKRSNVPLLSQITGGSQESGRRAGTSNVPLIVAFAKAFELAQVERISRTKHVSPLRDQLITYILENIPGVKLTGHPEIRLPNHASFVFENIDGNELLMHLDLAGFSCSSGSACKTGSPEPSEVLTSLGLSHHWALGSLRLTLGRETTLSDVDNLLSVLPDLIARLR